MDTSNQYSSGHDIFFTAIERTRMPMILTDPNQPDNPIVFSNHAFSELTGYDTSEILGRNCRFLQGEDTDRATVKQIAQGIEARRDVSVELVNYRKDGSLFWNALFISPVYDDSGNLKFFFASQLDVSRRQAAEDALRQAQKMEAVGQLTGGIAHDFNNMLTVIQGNIEIATAAAKGQHKITTPLDRASKGAQHAEQLTGQLLAFARKQRLNSVPTNLNEMLKNTIDIMGRTLGTNVEITTKFADDLALVDVDVVQLNTALINVVVNARDAMPSGGAITISTFNREVGPDYKWEVSPGSYGVISVKDSGHGIPDDIIKRVTEPFFTTKDVGKGTGMGLAMVYGFMKQTGGHLTISSSPQGTEVRFYIKKSSKARAHREAIEKTFKEQVKRTERLLVVEDNPQVMEMTRDAVEAQGYEVKFATSAQEALAIVEEGFEPQMLCSDIVMPGLLNGVDLARTLRGRYPGLKVLLCTGWSDRYLESDQEFAVLVKPYRPSQLIQRLQALNEAEHEG